MKKYCVTGMSCAACSARVEKAVSEVAEVSSVSVNLLTGTMTVEGGDSTSVIAAVTKAGYGASLADDKSSPKKTVTGGTGELGEERPILVRLAVSGALLVLLMYVSMGHVMWGLPLPAFLEADPVGLGMVQMLLSLAVLVVNQKFFINGTRGVLHGAPNMDTLVAMGSATAFAYSVYVLFSMSGAAAAGDMESCRHGLHGLYFESGAMIPALITLGKLLEARSKGRTTDALLALARLAPDTAVVIGTDGQERTVSVDSVSVGDIFILRPGDRIPVDGVILEGASAVDASALTGESIPVEVSEGDAVNAATVNLTGYVKCRAERVGDDTAHARIVQLVNDAAATKAPVAKIADRVAGVFVPCVIAVAAIVVAVWLVLGRDVGFAVARGISVLVISCPCALGLATPVAIMVGSGVGAKNGILYKSAAILEECGRVSVVALDKTGTLTRGMPHITDVVPAAGVSEEELLSLALSLEKKSEHPLAGAVIRHCLGRDIPFSESSDFTVHPGGGLEAVVDGRRIFGGSLKYISNLVPLSEKDKEAVEALANKGKTPLLFAADTEYIGALGAADKLREDSISAIAELKNMGIHVVMLTGDNQKTADAVGEAAGVSQIIAGLLPQDKAERIGILKRHGKVAMVGDGINDAPALTVADVGIAIGGGTDVAIDSADVVLMNSRLSDAAAAIRLSRRVLRNIKENLFWAFAYNIIGIPLAAGAFISIAGWEMNPMFGAAAMSLSSLIVVSNALRLNLTDVHDTKKDKKIKSHKKEKKSMEKVMRIEGMMCPHCEARVKSILEKIDGVEEAVTSHTEGTAVLTLSAEVDEAVLRRAVEDQGYTVL